MARRSDEFQAEALKVVDRIVERVDFELAAVARARIDLADRKRAAEQATRGIVERFREFLRRLDRRPPDPRRSRIFHERAQQKFFPIARS